MKKIISALFISMCAQVVCAEVQPIAPAPVYSLTFSIIQNQFSLDKINVQSASIVKGPNGIYKGLQLEIKKEFADAFTQMTKDGIGKTMNIIFNNRIITASIIRGSLGPNVLITGISKEDAQLFIDVLRKS